MNVGFEDLVGFLFEREELLRGKEGGIWARWEVRVTPWRAIRVTITIVLVLQEILTGRSVHLNLYTQMHTYDIIIQFIVEKARSSDAIIEIKDIVVVIVIVLDSITLKVITGKHLPSG